MRLVHLTQESTICSRQLQGYTILGIFKYVCVHQTEWRICHDHTSSQEYTKTLGSHSLYSCINIPNGQLNRLRLNRLD